MTIFTVANCLLKKTRYASQNFSRHHIVLENENMLKELETSM